MLSNKPKKYKILSFGKEITPKYMTACTGKTHVSLSKTKLPMSKGIKTLVSRHYHLNDR